MPFIFGKISATPIYSLGKVAFAAIVYLLGMVLL
ncbi:hypothetical protein QF042_001322 [Pedobacter sp. W3I1]|nr:hypothetical protein [Pedobacter sp. W3I1]